jgi:O-antigen ligase
MISLPRLPYREDKLFSVLVLLVLVVPLAFSWEFYEKFETIKLVLWAVLLSACLVLLSVKKEIYQINRVVVFLFGGLLFFGLFAALLAPNISNGFLGSYPRFTSSFLFYFLLIFTLWLFSANLDIKKWKFLLWVVYFDAVVVALVGIMQSYGVGYYTGIEQTQISRAPGLLGNPNFSSMFLVAVMPFTLPFFYYARNFAAKMYYLVSGILMLFAVILFSGRGSWLALAAGLGSLLLILLLSRLPKKFFLSLLLVTLIIFAFIGFFEKFARPGTLKATFRLSETNIDYRLYAWDLARKAISEHPVLGFGPGSTQIYFERFRDSNLMQGAGIFDDVHNLPLQMAVSAGLPFMLCFLGIWAIVFWQSYKKLKVDPRDFWTIAQVVSLVAWFAASCFNPVSTANFLLLAVVFSGSLINGSENIKLSIWTKPAFLLAALSLAIFGFSLAFGEFFFYQSVKNYQSQNFEKCQKNARLARYANPTNQLYYVYETACKIIINPDPETLKQDLKHITSLQAQSAKTEVLASNLSYLMYIRTNDSTFLDLAINYIQKSLEKDKSYAPRYTHAAFYLAENNQLLESKEYLKVSLSIDKTSLPAWLLLARVYQLLDRPEQMRYALNEAFKLSPLDSNLNRLNQAAKNEKEIKNLNIPALINFLQIES